MSAEPRRFFDQHAEAYNETLGHDPHGETFAAKFRSGLTGDILGVGGGWQGLTTSGVKSVTIVDRSPGMLAHLPADVISLVGDARRLPFDDRSFDHVVFSLVLHHITAGGGITSRSHVRMALREAHRVLRPGGMVWIREWLCWAPAYAAQLAMSPATSRLLGVAGIPLVIMHSERFYRRSLLGAGFRTVETTRMRAVGDEPWRIVRPIIGLPWFAIPRGGYPVQMALLVARK